MGRDRRLPARRGGPAARHRLAGRRLCRLSCLRYRETAADSLDRASLPGRIRRDVRRPRRRGLRLARAGSGAAALFLMDELARRLGERLEAAAAVLATAESCTGG